MPVIVDRWRSLPSSARWTAAGAVAFLVLLFGGKLYGDSRAREARQLARVDVADSLSRVYAQRFDSAATQAQARIRTEGARNDSLRRELAIVQATAATAMQNAARAMQSAASIPATVIARTPPEVLAALNQLQASNAELRTSLEATGATVTRLTARLDSTQAAAQGASLQLDTARRVIAAKDTVIAELRKLKTPRCRFLCVVKRIGIVAGVGAVGYVAGRVAP